MVNLKINLLQYFEILNLSNGCYSPVKDFMTKSEIDDVIFKLKYKKKFFPIPIYFNISKKKYDELLKQKQFIIIYKQKKIGIFTIKSIFKLNKKKYLKPYFGTSSTEHNGVKNFINLKDYFVSGKVQLENKIKIPIGFKPNYWRAKFKNKKIKTIAGFHSRNIPHSTHEKLHDLALKTCNGLFIHPMTGKLKKGDFTRNAIIKSYKIYLNKKNNKNIFFHEFLSFARFGGPREAAFHAIVRKNFGCTHFIVGRDHAGIKNFYSKYASQNFCLKHQKKIGIRILSLQEPYYCKKCKLWNDKRLYE